MISQNILFKIDNINGKKSRFLVGDEDWDTTKIPDGDGDGNEDEDGRPGMRIGVPAPFPCL